MRTNSDSWFCIICGKESGDIICVGCSRIEKDKQLDSAGSITKKQANYIIHLLSNANCEFDLDLNNLTMKSAGKLISDLLGWINNGEDIPPHIKIGETQPCRNCGKLIKVSPYYIYCKECHESVFRCHAKNKNGEQCSNRTSTPNGVCYVHSETERLML